MLVRNILLVALAVMALVGISPATLADTRSVVLVHGLSVDGSSWRPVYDILAGQGYNVSIVQLPLNSFDNDLHATQMVLDTQDGPVVLVQRLSAAFLRSALYPGDPAWADAVATLAAHAAPEGSIETK